MWTALFSVSTVVYKQKKCIFAEKIRSNAVKRYAVFFLLVLLLPVSADAQDIVRLALPNLEQLSSHRISQVIQDSEGFLWYATEGGGLCRDDGREIKVFRSDAERPDLLQSNDVACVAEGAGRYIIIGTFHGANVLDKRDYSIRPLPDVDDKRVDDILVSRNGHWWLTANKKLYEYTPDGELLNVYPGGEKYIFRLGEDAFGRILCTEWEGGQLRLEDGRLVRVSDVWPDAGGFVRTTTDRQGRRLITDIFGNCYAEADGEQRVWSVPSALTRFAADSVRAARGLSERPVAVTEAPDGALWFSTGRDVRRMKDGSEEAVFPELKDVSALAFTGDGTLWLATIFGTLMTYKEGQLSTDEYASNEYGDGVNALALDSLGCLILVSDRYIRLYDPVRQTLRQQSREARDVYCIELQETRPGERWSQPQPESAAGPMPRWVWWTLAALLVLLSALSVQVWRLHRQRMRFLSLMTSSAPAPGASNGESPATQQPAIDNEWLQEAIARVEAHMSDDDYSVEHLARDLCMSRMTLYRRIQSSTGQKPSEFIRTIRLRRAAGLLREGRLSITEISYDTGFSSVSYFSRCFRTMYGVPPTLFGRTTTAGEPASDESPN